MSEKNSFGLYDQPSRLDESPVEPISHERVQMLLQRGAFIMSVEEAEDAGLLSPYDNQEAVKLEVGG